MSGPIDKEYYVRKKPELIKEYEAEARIWAPFVFSPYGEIQVYRILQEARQNFESLIPQIPYIGGDENTLTAGLIEAVRYLAFYQAMKKAGKTAEEAGHILYNAILSRPEKPRRKTPGKKFSKEQFIAGRRERTAKNGALEYPGNYACEFVEGDGTSFDYGYDFTACTAKVFFHTRNADEFMPFYCYLDFPINKVKGNGFSRTMTLSEGHKKCNHRIKIGGETKVTWPPPFLKKGLKK